MFNKVQVLTHSSIKISGKQILYFDPFEIKEESHDADLIFVTHDHFDHFSPEDIQKIAREDTLVIMPESMREVAEKSQISNFRFLCPDKRTEEKGVLINTIPAYNQIKPFHTKEKGYVGYLVTMEDVTYYIAGDTDQTSENQKLTCDVALVPVGGTYTMDYKEAAALINQIKPELAIPTHYGTVAGSPEDGKKFAELIDKKIAVRVPW